MRRHTAAGAILILLLLTACGPRANPGRDVVERWLAAVAGGAADRGWSLIDESIKATSFNSDAAAYAAAMSAADWDAMDWQIASARSVGNGQTSVTVDASGRIPDVFDQHPLAIARCSGGVPTGMRFMVADFNGLGPQIGLGFWDGMSDIWDCGREGEPEFKASAETVWAGYGLEIANNTELPVTLVSVNGRDTDIGPCETLTFVAMSGPLTLSNEQGTIGETGGSGEENLATRYVVIGERDIYDDLHPPVYPIPPCGGVPAVD
jgi:hypothetical protein